MADEVQEVRTLHTTEGGEDVRRQTVTTEHADTGITKVQQFAYLLLGLLEGILAIRLILALLGANRSNQFADLIYDTTQPFVGPFQGLFSYDFEAGRSRFEIETVVAMIVYALLVWVVVRLLGLGKRHPDSPTTPL